MINVTKLGCIHTGVAILFTNAATNEQVSHLLEQDDLFVKWKHKHICVRV